MAKKTQREKERQSWPVGEMRAVRNDDVLLREKIVDCLERNYTRCLDDEDDRAAVVDALVKALS